MTAANSEFPSALANPPTWGAGSVVVPLALCLLGAACLPVDIAVATFFQSGRSLKFMRELLNNAEPFGHGVGVAYIVLTVFVLDARRRSWVPSLLAGSLGAGLAANLIKLLIIRTRPRNLDLALSTVWQSFASISETSRDSHSFPSAHMATATGLAVMLTAMYPQGRWLFFSLAVLTGAQRIHCSAHFPSDVCVGAAVGWIGGLGVLTVRRRRTGNGPAVADGGL